MWLSVPFQPDLARSLTSASWTFQLFFVFGSYRPLPLGQRRFLRHPCVVRGSVTLFKAICALYLTTSINWHLWSANFVNVWILEIFFRLCFFFLGFVSLLTLAAPVHSHGIHSSCLMAGNCMFHYCHTKKKMDQHTPRRYYAALEAKLRTHAAISTLLSRCPNMREFRVQLDTCARTCRLGFSITKGCPLV